MTPTEIQEAIFNIEQLRKDLITKRMIELNINLREAAKLCGVSSATLSRIENSKPPDVETFAKLVIWLGKSPSEYFRVPVKRQDGFPHKPFPKTFPHGRK